MTELRADTDRSTSELRASALRIAAESGCSVQTAKKWLRGEPVRRLATLYAIRTAARKLGIRRLDAAPAAPPPPPPKETDPGLPGREPSKGAA